MILLSGVKGGLVEMPVRPADPASSSEVSPEDSRETVVRSWFKDLICSIEFIINLTMTLRKQFVTLLQLNVLIEVDLCYSVYFI